MPFNAVVARWVGAGSLSPRIPEQLLSDPLITGEAYAEPASEVTRLLEELAAGTAGAANRLASLVYDELHAIAVAAMRREADGHTWQATELVHEAFSRPMGQQRVAWRYRHHFFGIASQAMRRLLVDHARARAHSSAMAEVALRSPAGQSRTRSAALTSSN